MMYKENLFVQKVLVKNITISSKDQLLEKKNTIYCLPLQVRKCFTSNKNLYRLFINALRNPLLYPRATSSTEKTHTHARPSPHFATATPLLTLSTRSRFFCEGLPGCSRRCTSRTPTRTSLPPLSFSPQAFFIASVSVFPPVFSQFLRGASLSLSTYHARTHLRARLIQPGFLKSEILIGVDRCDGSLHFFF